MNWAEILTTAGATIIPVGAFFAWIWNRLDKKFEFIDKKFESLIVEIKEIRQDIRSIDSRLSRLEGQDEEKFRNEVRLIAKGGG